jgi:hypothetical protein
MKGSSAVGARKNRAVSQKIRAVCWYSFPTFQIVERYKFFMLVSYEGHNNVDYVSQQGYSSTQDT